MTPHPTPTPATRTTRAALLLAVGGALVFLALPANAAGDDAVITVVFTGDDMGFTATSTKDISNIIVELCDGTLHKHDGLTGHTYVHTETQAIAAVYVKSGNNGIAGNIPPGAGERFANAGVQCSPTTSSSSSSTSASTTSTSESTTSTSDTTTSTSDTTTSTSPPSTTGSDSQTETTEIPVFGSVSTLALGIGGALGGTLLMLRRRL